MALPYTTLEAITRELVLDGCVDQIYGSNFIYDRMVKGDGRNVRGGRIKPADDSGGRQCHFRIQYAKITAGGTWDGARGIVETAPNETKTRGYLDWGHYYATISVDSNELDSCSGKQALGNILEEKMEEGLLKLKDDFATGIFSLGTDVEGFVGLRQSVCDSSNAAAEGVSATYAGIARGTYSWWDSNVLKDTTNYILANTGSAGSTLAYTMPYLLRRLYYLCTKGLSGSRPTVIITSASWYDCYQTWAQSKGQIPMVGVGTVDAKQRGDFGFEELAFNRIPFLIDSHCPTNYLYMINENNLFYQPRITKEIRKTKWKEATNQIEVQVMQLFLKGQLILVEPRSCGVIIGSNTANTGFDY